MGSRGEPRIRYGDPVGDEDGNGVKGKGKYRDNHGGEHNNDGVVIGGYGNMVVRDMDGDTSGPGDMECHVCKDVGDTTRTNSMALASEMLTSTLFETLPLAPNTKYSIAEHLGLRFVAQIQQV